MNVVAVIPARKNSKSIKDKNIRLINGLPMLVHSIIHAKQSKYINRIIVSTDSEEYAEIAKKYGAEVPFLRPEAISDDLSTDLDVFNHLIGHLKNSGEEIPEFFVHLRPTHPIRDPKDIDKMLEIIFKNETIDSVRSVIPSTFTPFKMWFMDEQSLLRPVISEPCEAYNSPRQVLPKTYQQNASIDVIRSRTITEKNSLSGSKIYGFLMETFFDIDEESDFLRAEKAMLLNKTNKYVIDVDGIIAQINPTLDYNKSKPNGRVINIINRLYDMGNKIVVFTARGYASGKDWTEITKMQLKNWGLKYHQLIFGKPDADFYIDDKYIDIDFLEKNLK